MFSTRLNPTKPSAAHRAILERVGAACRELRPIIAASRGADPSAETLADVFRKHGVSTIGIPKEKGGAGTEPLLITLAAERTGREGFLLARAFAGHIRAPLDDSTVPQGPSPTAEGLASSEREPEVSFSLLMNYRLCIAGSRVGALADCLEVLAESAAAWMTENTGTAASSFVEEQFGSMGANLEAARAIAYAAAELKEELDRNPTSEHLRWEAGTLVNEAAVVAHRAYKMSLSCAAQVMVGKESLVTRIPKRHEYGDWGNQVLTLEKEIGRYYLLL